jgi:signal transduction histidine kinase
VLTARLGRLRDWALFAAAALAPAVAVGVLGLRALVNEEAGARREVALGLDAAADRVSRDVERGVARAAVDLGGLVVDADSGKAAAALARVAPPFAVPVLLGLDRSVLVPAPAARVVPAPRDAGAPAPSRCRAMAAELSLAALSGRRDDPETATIRRELLAGCPEVRSASGRFLWPVVALDDRWRGAVSDEAVAGWIEAHAALLSEPEREATRIDTDRALEGTARDRASRALSTSWSRRDAIAAALAGPASATALRSGPDRSGFVTWHAGTSLGMLRPLDDGRLAGFVVDKDSVEDALASGAIALPAGMRGIAVVGSAARHEDAGEGRLVATAVIAGELALRLVPSDPGAVARQATRSRRLLAALGGSATALAFGLAALLFARMRAARRSSALRTDFVAAVSHELRTPIASMRMLAELLEEGRVEPGEQGEVFEALARESRRLGETVDRLLGFSRMAAGLDTFEERHPELPRVDRALDGEATAAVDAAQIRLAVDNLLANAAKYAPGGTPYRVSVERLGAGIAITVADHGPGVPRRDRRRIFEPFERADDRLSRATEGSGIGLSLVQHVARAHGGRASVAGEPGRGAAFTLWIPGSRST